MKRMGEPTTNEVTGEIFVERPIYDPIKIEFIPSRDKSLRGYRRIEIKDRSEPINHTRDFSGCSAKNIGVIESRSSQTNRKRLAQILFGNRRVDRP